MIERMTVKAKEAFEWSVKECVFRSHLEVQPLHMLYAFLTQAEGVASPLLEQMEVNLEDLREKTERELDRLPSTQGDAEYNPSQGLQRVLAAAESEADANGDSYISSEHLLWGLATRGERAKELLEAAGVTPQLLRSSTDVLRGAQKAEDPDAESKYQALEKYTTNLTRMARAGKLDPVIGRSAEIRRMIKILGRRTKNNPVVVGAAGVGKTAIVEGLARRIVAGDVPTRLSKSTVLSLDLAAMLAGSSYRGEFEKRIKAVLKELRSPEGDFVLFIDELHTLMGAGRTDGGAVDAANLLKPALARGDLRMIGATTPGEYRKYIERDPAFERRFQPIALEAPSVEETVAILRGLKERYELHHGVRIADEALIAAARLSDRYVSDRQLPDKAIDLVDEAGSRLRMEIDSMPTEIDQVDRRIMQLEIERESLLDEESQASRKRFEVIRKELDELRGESESMKVQWRAEKGWIAKIGELTEETERLRAEEERAEMDGRLDYAARIQYGDIPRLAERIDAAKKSLAELQKEKAFLREEVNREDVAQVVAEWTSIPVTRLLDSERRRLIHLEKLLGERVVGQDEALEAVSRAVRRARAGIQDPNRPIGSFLFLGPTGVGKTETARALAELLFDDERAILRFDMSEYMEQHSVARLIGAPPGYVGYDEGGQLTEAVRRKPHAIVLFDEIEKAHPKIFNALLQILDDGHLTDGRGTRVDFRSVIIVMTCNVGSADIIAHAKNRPWKDVVRLARSQLKKAFRPEFLNRVDDVVVYRPLGEKEIREITRIHLGRFAEIAKTKGIDLEFPDDVVAYVAKEGFDPEYGARPLKRAIQRLLQDPLAEAILRGEALEGTRATVSLSGLQANVGALVKETD